MANLSKQAFPILNYKKRLLSFNLGGGRFAAETSRRLSDKYVFFHAGRCFQVQRKKPWSTYFTFEVKKKPIFELQEGCTPSHEQLQLPQSIFRPS
jgi:hypothetical protein